MRERLGEIKDLFNAFFIYGFNCCCEPFTIRAALASSDIVVQGTLLIGHQKANIIGKLDHVVLADDEFVLGLAPVELRLTVSIRHFTVTCFAPITINATGNAEIQEKLLHTFYKGDVVRCQANASAFRLTILETAISSKEC